MPRVASPTHPTTADPEGAAFGVRLREARLRAGLTQAELAGERYTKAHISALEHGLANPSVEALGHLAGKLGTTSAHLLGGLEDGAWTSLEADLALATGAWSEARGSVPGPARRRGRRSHAGRGAGRAWRRRSAAWTVGARLCPRRWRPRGHSNSSAWPTGPRRRATGRRVRPT